MTSYDFETLSETEAAELLCSRFASLRNAGCDVERALVFATHPQFRVDDVELLIRSGSCELAATLLTLNQAA